jgi:hypothetical protein
VYNEAIACAGKVYNKATAPARKVYNEAIAPAWYDAWSRDNDLQASSETSGDRRL